MGAANDEYHSTLYFSCLDPFLLEYYKRQLAQSLDKLQTLEVDTSRGKHEKILKITQTLYSIAN